MNNGEESGDQGPCCYCLLLCWDETVEKVVLGDAASEEAV